MSQKNRVVEKEEKDKRDIGAVFNLARFHRMEYPSEPAEEDIPNQKLKKEEDNLYQNIVLGLESDMKNLGMEITYSSKVIMGEVAMNLLFLKRIKGNLIYEGLLAEGKVLKKTHVNVERNYDYPSKKVGTYYFYDYFPSNNESVHPVFEKLAPQLQKQINNGLKLLGLLPMQQIERQKLTIIKKLRQRYENLSGEVSIKAEKKIVNRKKLISQTQSNPKSIEV